MVGPVTRQLVGGPRDGRRVCLGNDEEYIVPITTPARLDWNALPSETVDAPLQYVHYRPAVAPTGERVLLADEAAWPDRFDTPEWPRRKIHAVVDVPWWSRRQSRRRRPSWPDGFQPIAHWRRLSPWLWRGDRIDPERDAGVRNLGRTVYVLGLPGGHPGDSRDAPRVRFATVAQTVESDLVAPRELALQALAGRRTFEHEIVDDLRRQAEVLQVPWCAVPDCPRWSSAQLAVGWATSAKWLSLPSVIPPGTKVSVCGDHYYEELRRNEVQWRSGWASVTRSPAHAFKITNIS